MTSGNFAYVPVNSIIVNRDERQRRKLEKIEELAESIRVSGLINPIVITREYVLVAGERRYTAHQHLGYEQIAVQFAEDLEPLQLHLIELEENVRRVDLDWQDHTNAVARFHEIQSQLNADWTQEKTADALNIAQASVGRHLMVKKAMDENVGPVLEAPKFTTAANFAQRAVERKQATALRDLVGKKPTQAHEPTMSSAESPPPPADRFANIIEGNFLEWSEQVQQTPFNLIHCDFPYGVSAGDTSGQSGAKHLGGYADSKDIYFQLLQRFVDNQERFVAQSAHLVFWFSMDYFSETVEILSDAGWRVNPFPLIWFKSDNTGILPDSNRGPRRVYETALLCSRGDRKIVRAVGNCFPAPTTKHFHMSEKSTVMLSHFFRMLVDESTIMLDPTCGSGNSVKVAEELGASYSLGIEMNADYVERAKQNLDL